MAQLARVGDHLVVVLRVGIDDARKTQFPQQDLQPVENAAPVCRIRREDHGRAVEKIRGRVGVPGPFLARHRMPPDEIPLLLVGVLHEFRIDRLLDAGDVDDRGARLQFRGDGLDDARHRVRRHRDEHVVVRRQIGTLRRASGKNPRRVPRAPGGQLQRTSDESSSDNGDIHFVSVPFPSTREVWTRRSASDVRRSCTTLFWMARSTANGTPMSSTSFFPRVKAV